jgi:hypothetical protein
MKPHPTPSPTPSSQVTAASRASPPQRATSSPTAAPPLRPNTILEAIGTEPVVRVVGFAYVVDLGRGVQPRLHTVHKDRACNCGDPLCPAIGLVRDWLKAGRLERAPDPPTGYTAFLPRTCPVCGAKVFANHRLSSRRRGIGWQCAVHGVDHYWLHQWESVKGWFFRDELLPGVKRGDLVVEAPFGYLPEANQPARALHERASTSLELVVKDSYGAGCGDPASPSGHVWRSALKPPPPDLRCLCGQMIWQDGIRLAYLKRSAEAENHVNQMNIGGQP